MRRGPRALLQRWLWALGTWWASVRRPRLQPDQVARQLHRSQTRGMGLRLAEWLRDRLRPRWLRVRRDDTERGRG